jgi:PAS domain S-box-containing protein
MGDGLVVADQNGKFLIWNPASEKIIGIGSLDIPKRNGLILMVCFGPILKSVWTLMISH